MTRLFARLVRLAAVLVRSTFYHMGLFKMSQRQFSGLNLGCGGTRIEGFWNIDASAVSSRDVIAHVERIKLSSNSVGGIYSSHVFEHIPRADAPRVLTEWHRVLKPGGKLYICVPDQEVLFRVYLDNLPVYNTENGKRLVDRACYITYGGQTNRHDFHYYGYSFTTLQHLLQSVGFENVQRFDRSKLDLALPQDVSAAQVDSFPMSLNVEASKPLMGSDDTRSQRLGPQLVS